MKSTLDVCLNSLDMVEKRIFELKNRAIKHSKWKTNAKYGITTLDNLRTISKVAIVALEGKKMAIE